MENLKLAVKILRIKRWNRKNIELAIKLVEMEIDNEKSKILYGYTESPIEIKVDGMDVEQYGECDFCGTIIYSSRKRNYCPRCGNYVYCT